MFIRCLYISVYDWDPANLSYLSRAEPGKPFLLYAYWNLKVVLRSLFWVFPPTTRLCTMGDILGNAMGKTPSVGILPTLTGFGVHSKLCSFVEGSSEFGGAPDPVSVVLASFVASCCVMLWLVVVFSCSRCCSLQLLMVLSMKMTPVHIRRSIIVHDSCASPGRILCRTGLAVGLLEDANLQIAKVAIYKHTPWSSKSRW